LGDLTPARGINRAAAWLVALCLAAIAAAPQSALADDQRLAGHIRAQMSAAGGSSGAWVVDASTGDPVFASRPDIRRTPASVEKLLTTGAAFEFLGPDTRLETVVRSDGVLGEDGVLTGNLYLQGSGDPSFDAHDLSLLASRVRRAGIESVNGAVYGDETYFNSPTLVAERLRRLLDARGILIERSARRGRTPRSSATIASVSSPPLSALVRHTNQVSDNYYAEMLLKGLAVHFGGTGSTAAGLNAVRRFEQAIGVSSIVRDGSGLSRQNAISPHQVGRLLMSARRRPWFDPFYRSLPLAGRTGTLRDRMRNTAAAGRCRAKTGTLRGVSGLAGYCRSRSGRQFVFALLMNGVNLYRARAAQDRIAAALAN
jgi:D-alanyl-D-alanine carboxypeptidase/D-alanyl-D-alanine-endopeptidase (penicillin-binding protein 4)